MEGDITWIGGATHIECTHGGWCYPWRVVLPVEGQREKEGHLIEGRIMMHPVSQYGSVARRDPKWRGTAPDRCRGDGGTVGNSGSIAAVTTPDKGGHTGSSESNQSLVGGRPTISAQEDP